MKHYGDITKISGYAVEPVDVITGGSPCQDLSVAGKRAGMSKACPVCGYKAVGNSEEDICISCSHMSVRSRGFRGRRIFLVTRG